MKKLGLRFTNFLKNFIDNFWFLSGTLIILAFIPTYIFIILWNLLNPETFWETFVMIAGGFVFGGFQIFLIGVALFLILSLKDDIRRRSYGR